MMQYFGPGLRRRKNRANSRWVEIRCRVAVRELLQGGIFGVELAHAVLQVDHLNQVTVTRFILVKKSEYGLRFVDILGTGSQSAYGRLKHGPGICNEVSKRYLRYKWP